jgi:hypothetical protein
VYNHKNLKLYWDAIQQFTGNDTKLAEFNTLLICELSADTDEIMFRLAIERAIITYRTGEKIK